MTPKMQLGHSASPRQAMPFAAIAPPAAAPLIQHLQVQPVAMIWTIVTCIRFFLSPGLPQSLHCHWFHEQVHSSSCHGSEVGAAVACAGEGGSCCGPLVVPFADPASPSCDRAFTLDPFLSGLPFTSSLTIANDRCAFLYASMTRVDHVAKDSP